MDFSNLDYYLDIAGKSKHINPQIEYNETNPGFGLTAEKEIEKNRILSLMTGRYKNSYGDSSYYGAGSISKRFGNDYYADLGLVGGVATGYENRLQPLGGIMAQFGKKDLGRLRVIAMPGDDNSDAVFMMNLGIPIK